MTEKRISHEVGKGSLAHNNRMFTAKNIDPSRTPQNVVLVHIPLEEAYKTLFDPAIERYNKKQSRKCRKIQTDYFTHLFNHKICEYTIIGNNKQKSFYEDIVQVGTMHDTGCGTPDAEIAKQCLQEYMEHYLKNNPNFFVFNAVMHMDEATPHIHIDFVPFTTGSKRGLDTRVSLKQALVAQGFKGGTRGDTEWSQWVLSEKEQLAAVMERYGIEWEQKGTHDKHLSVLDYKKQEREKEISALDSQIAEKTDVVKSLSDRVQNFDDGIERLQAISDSLDTAPEYNLPEPSGLMTAKTYKTKFAEPLIKRLKSLIKTVFARCFEAWDSYHRLNATNASLYRENQVLSRKNSSLNAENAELKEQNRDYKLLRKVFGSKQIDGLLEQAKQSKQRDKRFRDNQNER